MPDSSAMPSTQDYLAAYSGAVSARRSAADVHRGSRYDVLGGVAAVLFSRVSGRDRDAFRATYFDTAQDTELDELEAKRFADVGPRVLLTKGQGTVSLHRPTVDAAGGDFLAGTRIAVILGGSSETRFFEVTEDTAIGAAALTAVNVPIQCVLPGSSTAISLNAGDVMHMRIDDPLWDNTWVVDSLACSSGTDREKDADYRVRTKAARTDNRVGYVKRITQAMTDAGAARIALFASDYLGPDSDCGLNRICVGDVSYQATQALLNACRLAVYQVCVQGTAVQVLPMQQQGLALSVIVELWDSSDHVGRDMLQTDISKSLINYFSTRQNPFLWRIDAMEGVALKAARQQAQAITITTTSVEPTQADLFDVIPLVAWSLDPRRITISFA